jgi:hypothetical protein
MFFIWYNRKDEDVRRVNANRDSGYETGEVESITFRTRAPPGGETQRGKQHGTKAGKPEDV